MDRNDEISGAHVEIKNGIGYPVKAGFYLKNGFWEYEGESDWMEFYWYDVESGANAFIAGVTALAALFAFL